MPLSRKLHAEDYAAVYKPSTMPTAQFIPHFSAVIGDRANNEAYLLKFPSNIQ
jgi:hypothetical protein